MLPSDVIKWLENEQRFAYKESGIDINNITDIFETRRKDFRDFSTRMPADMLKFFDQNLGINLADEISDVDSKISNQNPTTKYQDPGFQRVLEKHWRIINKVENYYIDNKYNPIEMPAIGSAPIGNTNAIAQKDVTGRTATLFDDSLLDIGHVLAGTIAHAICEDRGGTIGLHFETENIKNRVRCMEWLRRAVSSALDSSATHGIPNEGRSEILGRLSDVPSILIAQDHIYTGFITFILAHEYGHLRLKHHEQRLRLNGEVIRTRPSEQIRSAIDTYYRRYTSRFPIPTPERLENFATYQWQEHEADAEAFVTVLYAGNVVPRNPGDRMIPMLIMLGGLLFFWGFEYLERARRLRATGTDGRDDPLYSQDLNAQNLLIRDMHPGLMSRLAFISHHTARSLQANHAPNPLVNIVPRLSPCVETVFKVIWEAEYERLREKAFGPDCLDNKWRSSLSEGKRAIGLI